MPLIRCFAAVPIARCSCLGLKLFLCNPPLLLNYFLLLLMLLQAEGELKVLRSFFENFSGDGVRFAFHGSFVSGDHQGQQTQSYR